MHAALSHLSPTAEGAQDALEDLAALITPKPGREGSSRSAAIRLTLGLPNGDGIPSPWPRQSEVAARLEITQASVSNNYRQALKTFAAEPRLSAVCDAAPPPTRPDQNRTQNGMPDPAES